MEGSGREINEVKSFEVHSSKEATGSNSTPSNPLLLVELDDDMEGTKNDVNEIREDEARSTESRESTSFHITKGHNSTWVHGYGQPSVNTEYQEHKLLKTKSGITGMPHTSVATPESLNPITVPRYIQPTPYGETNLSHFPHQRRYSNNTQGYLFQPHQLSARQSSLPTSIGTGNVTYESDPEDNVYGHKTTQRKRQHYNGDGGGLRRRGSMRENQSRTESKGHTRGGATGFASPRHTTVQAAVNSIQQLIGLGVWEILGPQESVYRMIKKYAKNGCQVPSKKIHIHSIFKLQSGNSSFGFNATFQKLLNSPQLMLLWFKTTPGSVRHLQQRKDGIVAFYDRLVRALTVNPNEAGATQRQIILLCEVDLGKQLDSYKGYHHWSTEPVPSGITSVVAQGHLVPNVNKNKSLDSLSIPCGETFVHPDANRHLPYNEYMVFEAKQYKLKYAVDVEVEPINVEASRYSTKM